MWSEVFSCPECVAARSGVCDKGYHDDTGARSTCRSPTIGAGSTSPVTQVYAPATDSRRTHGERLERPNAHLYACAACTCADTTTSSSACSCRSALKLLTTARRGLQGRASTLVTPFETYRAPRRSCLDRSIVDSPDDADSFTHSVKAAPVLPQAARRTRSTFRCPRCSIMLTQVGTWCGYSRKCADAATGQPWRRICLRAVLINYSVGEAHHEKAPDRTDLRILDRVAELPLPSEVPTNPFPIDEMYHGSRLAPKGFRQVHHVFVPRAVHALAAMWRRVNRCADVRLRQVLLFFIEQAVTTMSLLNRFRANQNSQSNQVLSGVYYIPSQVAEISPWYRLDRKITQVAKVFRVSSPYADGVQSLLQATVAARSYQTIQSTMCSPIRPSEKTFSMPTSTISLNPGTAPSRAPRPRLSSIGKRTRGSLTISASCSGASGRIAACSSPAGG